MPIIIYNQDPSFDPGKLSRSEKVQKSYDELLDFIKNNKETPEKYLLDGDFWEDGRRLLIADNEFPLDLPKGQTHKLLWCRDRSITDTEALNYIFATYRRGNTLCIWRNEAEKQSVKGLVHWHFITTKRFL